jgi:hypothetical protein
MGIIVFHIGLLLPILAGVLERPFFTLAGMDRSLVWLSIWLNCLASLLMNVLSLFGLAMFVDGEMFAWIAFVVAGGAGLKYLWLRKRVAIKPPMVAFSSLLAGSIVSAVVIALLPLMRQILAPWSYSARYIRTIQSFEPIWVLGTLAICIVIYVIAFRRTRHVAAVAEPEQRGFEVIPPRASTALAAYSRLCPPPSN